MQEQGQARIAFIGGGNMARAMIGGLVSAGHDAGHIDVGEPDDGRRETLRRDWPGLNTHADNRDAAAGADLCVLAVKPDVLPRVARALAGIDPVPLYLSVAAGVRAADLARWLGGARVARAMPNQGALVGRSATGLFAGVALSATERQRIERVAHAIGVAVWVDSESDLDTVTAVAGSGPAYFFLVMELLVAGARDMGLDDDVARTLVTETAAAAAVLADDVDTPLATLRHNVTSPGGTTAAAIDYLTGNGIDTLFHEALRRARARAEALADAAASG